MNWVKYKTTWRKTRSILCFMLIILGSSCSSYQKFKHITEEMELPSRVFKSDFEQTWQAIIEVVKRYDIAQQNKDAGVIKTRWIDNTMERNFQYSFSRSDAVKAAKVKLIITAVKGFRSSREVTKVTIYKRQLIEQDFLQGWKETPTDGIQEKIILYRIQRLIEIDNQLRALDKQAAEEQLQEI